MKNRITKIIPFILAIIIVNAYPLSSKSFEAEDIKLISNDSIKFKDFVISEDNKFIYILDTTNKIKKYFYETGDLIWEKQIENDTKNPHFDNWIFLSRDAKAYCTVFYTGYYNFNAKIIIYDIENSKNTDTITIPLTDMQYSGIPKINNIYLIVKSINDIYLMVNAYDDMNLLMKPNINSYRYYELTGGLYHYVKKNQTWGKANFVKGTPFSTLEFRNSDFVFYQGRYYLDYTYLEQDGESQITIYSLTTDLICPENQQQNIYYYFSKYEKYGLNYESETDTKNLSDWHHFSSGFYVNNKIYLKEKGFLLAPLYEYDINNKKLTRFDMIDNAINYKLLNTPYDDFFWAIEDNVMHIYGIDVNKPNSTKYLVDININNLNKIDLFKNSRDFKYIFLTDTIGNLYRISYKDIFKLRANFRVDDTLVSVGDTLRFTSMVLGRATKYHWDFGDGTSSSEKNPSHVYQDWGYYTVKLIVENETEKDTAVKAKYIHTLPLLKPRFDYSVEVSYPTKIIFHNISFGKYDSLKWEFEENITSGKDTVERLYFVKGTYPVSLTLYRLGEVYSHSEELKINVIEQALDRSNLYYEFTDTNYSNYIARNAYDDKFNGFLYHVEGKDCYYGLYRNSQPVWSMKEDSIGNYIFRRNADTFAFLNDSTIYNFDWNNATTHRNDEIKLAGRKATCRDENIVFVNFQEEGNINPIGEVIDINNRNVRNIENKKLDENDTFLKNHVSIAVSTNNKTDYLFTSDADYNGIAYSATFINGYRTNVPFENIRDMLRLNDNNLVILYPDQILIFEPDFETSATVILSNANMKTICKMTNDVFIVAGDSAAHPSYWIFDKDGKMLKDGVLPTRYGSFNFVSKSYDGAALLAGWRYKYYPVINPYYLKISYTGKVSNNMQDEKYGTDVLIYPNPATNYIDVMLSGAKEPNLSVKVYDVLGVCVGTHPLAPSREGERVRLDVSGLTKGVYFVKINNRMYKFLKI